MKKPRILIIYDVPNWGGYYRAIESARYLSDIFHVDLVEESKFHKNYLKLYKGYDLYYLSYHTMLMRGNYPFRIPFRKIVTMITGSEVLKPIFGNATYYNKSSVFDKDLALKNWKELSNRCAAIFYNNMYVNRELKKLFKGSTFYVPRGVDHKVFKYLKYDLDGPFVTCFVGKNVKEKGLESHIKPASKKSGVIIIENVRNWTNALTPKEMCKFYNKCNVYMVASTIDGTPNPMLEAASCYRPIIANKIGNAPEFIKDGYNGFLVERNIDAYVEKLNWMKKNREKTKKMGYNARVTIMNEWLWEKTINTYEKPALKKILGVK